MAVVVTLLGVAATSAQTPQTGKPAPAAQPATTVDVTEGDRRPATTTHNGDTGLWFVPTGEILPRGKWSFSPYRVNFDYNEGFTDVSNFPVTFGVGLGDRAELFGAWHVVRRIDRDVRPIFTPTAGGGQANDYPRSPDGPTTRWVTSGSAPRSTSRQQWRQQPVTSACAAMVQGPDREKRRRRCRNREDGLGEIDGIVSKRDQPTRRASRDSAATSGAGAWTAWT